MTFYDFLLLLQHDPRLFLPGSTQVILIVSLGPDAFRL